MTMRSGRLARANAPRPRRARPVADPVLRPGAYACQPLHQLLIESGSAIDKGETERGYFGPSTYLAVTQFQRRVGIKVDGLVGPQTWAALRTQHVGAVAKPPGWRCVPAEAPPHLVPVLSRALQMVGTLEQPPGSNRGALIDAWTGMADQPAAQAGPPWCIYFLSAMFDAMAGGCPWGVVGSAWGLLLRGQREGWVLLDGPPQPGDVWLFVSGDPADKRAAHPGHGALITFNPGMSRPMSTIDGNSGNMVAGRLRQRGDASAILRIPAPR